MTMVVFGPNETPSAVHHRLMMLVDMRMHVMASRCLSPCADMRVGVFEDGESRHQFG